MCVYIIYLVNRAKHPRCKDQNHYMYSWPRGWRLSLHQGGPFVGPLIPLQHHNTTVLKGLRRALTSSPIMPKDVSLKDSQCDYLPAWLNTRSSFCYVSYLTHLCRPVRSTFAVRETASLGIMGEPRVPPLNPSESIVL